MDGLRKPQTYDILKMIHLSIRISNKYDILTSLKEDASFHVFKNCVKRKLQALKFDPKGTKIIFCNSFVNFVNIVMKQKLMM